MKRFLLTIFTASLLWGCTTTPKRVYEDSLEITEINPNKFTYLAKQNLFHLAKVYDLRPFLFTKKIHIQSYVIPHSHPVLTLNTRHAETPHHLLSTWMHEEFHWWMGMKPRETDKAIAEFSKIYPKLPASEGKNKRSTYLHMAICFLEYRALVHFVGEKEARELLQELVAKDKIYPWVYTQVLNDETKIRKIIMADNLLPPPLK